MPSHVTGHVWVDTVGATATMPCAAVCAGGALALSLEITALLGAVGFLTSGNECQRDALGSCRRTLLTVAYRPVWHASGTVPCCS